MVMSHVLMVMSHMVMEISHVLMLCVCLFTYVNEISLQVRVRELPLEVAPWKGGSVSSVEIKYFTVPDVDLQNTVSSVDLV